jgi:phosphatidylglycerol---prolipoprotein diacylglyceryl transferase
MLHLWPLTIHRYGLMYLFGILIGRGILWWLGRQTWFQWLVWPKVTDILQKQLDDLITWIVLGIIIGGRLGHVLIYDPSYYLTHPLEIIQVRKGGMSFVWWFIWVWLSVRYRVRREASALGVHRAKLTVKEFLTLTDLIVLVLPIGIALWRWGNAINQELIWQIYIWTNSEQLQSLQLLRIYDSVDTQLRWNTNLLEWLGEWVLWFITTVILFTIQKIKKFRSPWLITGGFMIFYAIIRIILENLRDNPSSEYITLIGQIINKTQLWMIGFIIVGIVVVVKWRRFLKN